MCAWLYSALEAPVNSTCILYCIYHQHSLLYLRNDRTITKVSTDYTRVPRLRSVTVLYGILSGSDWLRPRVKEDHVQGGHLHTARESQPGTLYIRFQLMGRSRRKWKKHTCATRLTCSRIDNSASIITPRLRTTVAGSMALEPARMTLLPGGIFRKLAADPNQRTSVLLAFNCKRYAAQQWLTSVKQSVRVDTIRETSADGPCRIPWMSSANRW